MSRGLGPVERSVLHVIGDDRWTWTTRGIVEAIYGPEPSAAEVETVRRAIRSLARKGHVRVEAMKTNVVRLAPDDDQGTTTRRAR